MVINDQEPRTRSESYPSEVYHNLLQGTHFFFIGNSVA